MRCLRIDPPHTALTKRVNKCIYQMLRFQKATAFLKRNLIAKETPAVNNYTASKQTPGLVRLITKQQL